MFPKPIYFFTAVQAQPDIPELQPICTPDSTEPHMKPVINAGPPAIPINIIGPIS
jgi:hypothetical protein